jgi:hypothetical protein
MARHVSFFTSDFLNFLHDMWCGRCIFQIQAARRRILSTVDNTLREPQHDRMFVNGQAVKPSGRHSTDRAHDDANGCCANIISTYSVEPQMANVAVKRENSGLFLLTDMEADGDTDAGGMMVDQVHDASVEPDSQPTYYLSNAIGSAFQVCSAVEQDNNVEPVGSVPALFLLHNGCITAARTMNGDDSEAKFAAAQAGNWPTSNDVTNKETPAMYYFALSDNMQSSSDGLQLPQQAAVNDADTGTTSHQTSNLVTEAHLMKVFQQDGIGTVVASIGELRDNLIDSGNFTTNFDKVSSMLVETGKIEHVFGLESGEQSLSFDDSNNRLLTAEIDTETKIERFGVESKG